MISKIVIVILFSLVLFTGLSGCSTVPVESERSSMPWAQPEQWERSGMTTPGVGF